MYNSNLFALNTSVYNQRQTIRLIYCNTYLIYRYPYGLLLCSGHYLDSQGRYRVKKLPEGLDTQLSSSFKKKEKFTVRKY